MGRDLESLEIRAAGSGYWRVVEKGKDIHIPQNDQVMGKRNTLVFWEVQGSQARLTKWVMHEFRLVLIANSSKHKIQMEDWVVYRILKKKDTKKVKNPRGTNDHSSSGAITDDESEEVINFNAESDSFLGLL
ncbi:NAC domain-containing protein 21/22-like [Lotus japonicus]|uniref:NAC domain-containing protein 21/22-like n=1 Tax=Lotus japonicus TaxID=34305 RepID=UPI00258EA790|nr:NAC domain-containing protein 21/22-like [Lotus japonicus]